jgi:succinate dehydrogenase/fumarate reductase-like Fe-S protein
VWGCDRALECSRVCPLGVYPARHIAVLRRAINQATDRKTSKESDIICRE